MALHETEALVIKSYPLAEADKIVVFLTRSHGLVRGVAKGAKRLTSRFGSSLEPFSFVRLEFFQSGDRELVTIKRADLVESLFSRVSDDVLLTKLAYFSEIVSVFAPPSDPDDRLYRMTRICLETAASEPGLTDFLTLYFEVWVLRLGGFLPSWKVCSRCGRQLEPGEETVLRADFRLACASCERIRQTDRVDSALRELLVLALKLPPPEFARSAGDFATSVPELSAIMKRMMASVVGREGGALTARGNRD